MGKYSGIYDVYWIAESSTLDDPYISDGEAIGLAKHRESGEIRWGTDIYHFCYDPQCVCSPFEIASWKTFKPIDEEFWLLFSKYELTEDNCWDVEEFQSLLDELKK